MLNRLLLSSLIVLLAACGSQPPRPVSDRSEAAPVQKQVEKLATPKKRGGGYYLDDGPGDNAPSDAELAAIPDAIPRKEPLHRFANNPYSVLGRDYVPLRTTSSYVKTGIASWYGKKFHGQKTSSGETYDMYGMTAAHPVLPIPSYVRVTNEANGKSVIVRINDRGPFHSDRLIDLSYTAAWKLGYIGSGSTRVTVELLHPDSDTQLASAARTAPVDDPVAKATQPAATEQTSTAAPVPPPAAPVAVAPAAPGAYVQLGAFGNPDNAESFRAHLARELDWLGDRLRLEPAGKLLRVQAGPFRDRAEASAAADRIRSELGGITPTIVLR